MKKLFLLIPAILLSLAVNAKEIEISSGTTNIISTTIADAGTKDGDVIVLTDNGPYVQANQILFTKSITLRAAEGKLPVVAQQYYSELKNSAQVNIIGIKFDGSLYNSVGAIDHCFRCGDATDNKTLYMENCEITSFKSYIFYIKGGNNLKSCTLKDCKFSSSKRFFYVEGTTTVNQLALDGCEIYSFSERAIGTNSSALIGACNIENCYFHNNASNSLYMENTSESNINITNSTFVDNAIPAYSGVVHAKATSGTISVNHCTFYNCPVSSSSYGTVQFESPNAVVSNSIFVLPTTTNVIAIYMPNNNTVNNCLTYKYTYDTDGILDGISKTNCKTGNPYFMNTNPANYDFTIWTTSPAHGTANDGYDLGDYTRWNTDPATHVATVNITDEATNSLKAAVDAALPGDEIILAAGTYEESESILLDKEITIKAAASSTPIVVPVNGFAISNGADVTIQGLKFDATSITSNLIYANDATAGNELTLEGCELYNTGSHKAIHAGSSAHLDACVINNCYFHNGNNSAIHIEEGSTSHVCDRIEITNSTFANYSGFGAALIQIASKGSDFAADPADDQEILVDHCTFYNFTKTVDNTFGFIDSRKSANVTLSNCIFANPTAQASLPSGTYNPKASQLYGGSISNCLIYNVPNHRTESVTPVNPISADPLFTDAAHGDFTFPGDYANDNVSPARNAGTDGSDLGDPRWYTPATYPETDFASGYAFTAAKAKLNGNITLETNELAPTHPYIRYIHINATTGTAEWIIKTTKACYVQATVNMADNKWTTDPSDGKMFDNHKHIFVVEVRNANNVLVGSVQEGPYTDGSEDGYETYPTVNLPGTIHIPAEGVYTVKLLNPRKETRCGVANVTLAYAGGDVTDIAASGNTSLDVADAWFEGCTRGADRIVYPSSETSSAWIKWNIAATETKFYDLTLNINAPNAHGFTAALYEDESASPVASVTEGSYVNTTGVLALELGRVNLVGGKNYVVKLTNAPEGSVAEVLDLTFAPVAASATELPGTLAFSNAVLSANAHVTDGNLYFAPIGDTNPKGEWARWAVTTDHAGLFLFTMGVNSTNSQQSYKISIYNNLDTRIDYYEAKPSSGAQTLKHYFSLPAGNYSVQVENTTAWSNGYLTSLVVTEPSVVTLDESATDNTAWADKVVDKNAEGPLYDVQIIRSFRGGMNNTFCLPFAVSSSQCKEVFGNDVEIYTLGGATIEDYILNLTVDPASDIWPGTPVLIKPARDIVNPVFTDVKFTAATASATTKTNANFVGSFIKTPLTASDDLLYVGPENKVFFLSVDYDMPGMRAWFVIHDVPAALGSPKALRSARIIEKEQITTSILNVETSGDATRKVLYNGQIVIIRGNEMYNMQGQHIQ